MDSIETLIRRVNSDQIRDDIFWLCDQPLPFRTANRTLPGHRQSTLDEADAFLARRLQGYKYHVSKERCRCQAFGFNPQKPRRSAYAPPKPDDPWYDLFNLYAEHKGQQSPDEIILLVAHKDSQSWFESPGAYDNAVGTAANLEIARLVADYPSRRTIRFLWCNEEHRPWTSVVAAEKAKARGDKLIAIFNTDSLGGKSQAEIDAKLRTNVTLYTTREGKRLAERVSLANERYRLGLAQRIQARKTPGDDDGSFVKAGFPAAIANLGSFPYVDPNYHDLGDTANKVDLPNVTLATQMILAAVLMTDEERM